MHFEVWLGTASRFKPYLDMLPRRLDTPLFWSDAEVESLRGLDIFATVASERLHMRREFRVLRALLDAHCPLPAFCASVSPGSYTRLGSLVRAYAFSGSGSMDAPDSSVRMVPLADMLNHSTRNNAHLFLGGGGGGGGGVAKSKSIRTKSRLRAGAELWNSYGDLSNGQLLCRYATRRGRGGGRVVGALL